MNDLPYIIDAVDDSSNTLYSFYDLHVSPPTCDFLKFMQYAELRRRRYNLEKIHFIFVPGPKEGFRDDNLARTIPQRSALMRNLVVPSCWLLPTCHGVSWLGNRTEAIKLFEKVGNVNIFPRNYTPETPTSDYIMSGLITAYLRGEEMVVLQEPFEYTSMVQGYLSARLTTQKLITVTVRDTPYNTERNTNQPEWQSFLDSLDASEYKVLVVPDTYNIWSKNICGFEYCEMASLNVLFRTALYRQAYLNMFTPGGPAEIALYSNSPLLMFRPLGKDIAATADWYRVFYGMEPDDHHQHAMYKLNQRLAWGADKAGYVQREFNRYIGDFPEFPHPPVKEHGIQSDTHRNLLCLAALLYVLLQMNCQVMPEFEMMSALQGYNILSPPGISSIEQEDIDTIKAIINLLPNDIRPRHILGVIAHHIGDFDIAAQSFDDCSKLANEDSSLPARVNKELRLLKALMFEKGDEIQKSLCEYIELDRSFPNDPEILKKISMLSDQFKAL